MTIICRYCLIILSFRTSYELAGVISDHSTHEGKKIRMWFTSKISSIEFRKFPKEPQKLYFFTYFYLYYIMNPEKCRNGQLWKQQAKELKILRDLIGYMKSSTTRKYPSSWREYAGYWQRLTTYTRKRRRIFYSRVVTMYNQGLISSTPSLNSKRLTLTDETSQQISRKTRNWSIRIYNRDKCIALVTTWNSL